MRRPGAAALIALALVASACNHLRLPDAPDCPVFRHDNYWHADVSDLPVHPQSSQWVDTIGADAHVHMDFGSGLWNGSPIGIPYTTVGEDQPLVDISFYYDDESDPGPYPIPPDAPIEGGSDKHVLVVDRDACVLYEVFDAEQQPDGTWDAGSGAVWDLRSNDFRPAGWTSADAAGLPILPALVRYDEVVAGDIGHALRFTAPVTRTSYIWPARHQAGSTTSPSAPPMGAWFRLKASVDPLDFPEGVRPILVALQTHGMILADNGSPWYMQGVPDPAWNNTVLRAMRDLDGSDFEAVDTTSLIVDPESGQAATPG